MRTLFLTQVFYPDVVAVSQYVMDLAGELADRGNQVTVLSARRAYDDPAKLYAPRETWRGIDIVRVLGTGLGKKALWRRAIDFASVIVLYCLRLLALPRQDLVIALTAPPLASFLAALYTRIRGGRLVLWIMDLNPDQAIAAGALSADSRTARLLGWMLKYSLRRADHIVVLDRFMQERILAKGVDASRVAIAPPWGQDSSGDFDAAGREAFRRAHALEQKFVVMYSGNHSPCHPLDTVLEAARRVADDDRIQFLFVGGGSEQPKVAAFASRHGLRNIRCLPYQPLSALSGSLSAADLHLVVLGDPFRGIVHPSKIYNVLRLGIPFLYIGPLPSHISDLTPPGAEGDWGFFADHGQVDRVVEHVRFGAQRGPYRAAEETGVAAGFAESVILPRLIHLIEPGSPAQAGAKRSIGNIEAEPQP